MIFLKFLFKMLVSFIGNFSVRFFFFLISVAKVDVVKKYFVLVGLSQTEIYLMLIKVGRNLFNEVLQ